MTLVFWIEPLQSSSRLGTVVWAWPFRHLGHCESWTLIWLCRSAGEKIYGEGRDKVIFQVCSLQLYSTSLSDLHGTVCTKHERSSLSIKAEGVLKAGDYCSLPFLFFLYQWACPNPSKESIVRALFAKVLVLLYGRNAGRLAEPWFHCHVSLKFWNP